MNKSLLKIGIATLLASGSTVLLASSVQIPNSFTSGEPAVASEVNDNFTAVADAVNDNDSRVTTNAAGVTTNAGDITTNAGDITTNAGNITTNTGNITTNAGNITANADNIQTNTDDIAALQSGASCSSDMVAVGSLCVDLYEARIFGDPAGTGTQVNLAGAGGTDDIACSNDGSDCGASAANPIYALSITGRPSARITWYQAAQACANVGKRLPTLAEWQMAAQGTPTGNGAGCNTNSGVIANNGANAACVSTSGAAGGATTGAFDMVGNIWEWVTEVALTATEFNTTDTATGYAMGEDFNNSSALTPSPKVIFELDNTSDAGLNTESGVVGFRCVR